LALFFVTTEKVDGKHQQYLYLGQSPERCDCSYSYNLQSSIEGACIFSIPLSRSDEHCGNKLSPSTIFDSSLKTLFHLSPSK